MRKFLDQLDLPHHSRPRAASILWQIPPIKEAAGRAAGALARLTGVRNREARPRG